MKLNKPALMIIIVLLGLGCVDHVQAQYDTLNMSLYSNWSDASVPAEPMFSAKYSSCYGWASGGKEYAILGASSGTYFIDVTNPSAPIQCDFVAGRRDSCVWREYKTYQHYVYMVSDDAAPNSFQIADLAYLPDSVHVIYDSTDIFSRSHTVFIDGNKLYCGTTNGISGTKSMAVYSLSNPTHPTLLRTLNQDYPSIPSVHDMFVRNDTVYASCGNTGFFVYKFDTVANQFNLLTSLTSYGFQGYNHSSFITENGKTLVFADEVPTGLPMKIYDISDFSNFIFKANFQSHVGATPHNPYIKGNKVILSYYEDGIQIYDISNPSSPVLAGYFDTHPQNGTTYNGYHGCWGAYHELPSGILLASDMQNGLFVLNVSTIFPPSPQSITEQNELNFDYSVFPNPTQHKFNIHISSPLNTDIIFCITDITGQKIQTGSISPNQSNMSIDITGVATGMYFINLISTKGSVTKKLLVN